MSAPPRIQPHEALLADHAWAQRLARRLVEDPSRADDLIQEAWVRALERPPGKHWPLRSWLGGVVRNLARQERRADARREAREHAAARDEASTSAAEALERMAVQQSVVHAVLQLEEPYRSTIVLRFYENLPPRKIAALERVPVATVKTRLARGLAELRERLDRERGGDGRSWALFLLPLAARPSGYGPFVAGVLTVNAILKVTVASAALLALVFWLARRESTSGLDAIEANAASVTSEPELPPALRAPLPTLEGREAVTEPEPTHAPEENAPAVEPEIVRGRVVDPSGASVAGVRLGLRRAGGMGIDDQDDYSVSLRWDEELRVDAEPVARSGADGRFSFSYARDDSGHHIVSLDERWETVMAVRVRIRTDVEHTLVVAPRFRLLGRVLDESGASLARANLSFNIPAGSVSGPGLALEDSTYVGWRTTSDAQGGFALERLPAVRGARLIVKLAPFEPAVIGRDLWSNDELEIVLKRPPGDWIEGRVEARGRALAGALVTLGRRGTRSGEDGSFRLSLAKIESENELCAAAPDLLPTRLHGDRNEDGSVRWPAFVRLVLEGEPLELAGLALDAAGAALAGQEVWLDEPTIACADEQGFPVLLESFLVQATELRHGAKTDEGGRFRIGGLEPRDYRLRVVDPSTALVTIQGPFAAGDQEIVLHRPADAFWPHLRGTVRTRNGAPLAGVKLQIERETGRVGIEGRYFGFQAWGSEATTDADGRFELRDVPRGEVELHVRGQGVADPELELAASQDPDHVEVIVGARVRLQVQVAEEHRPATRVELLDAAGNFIELTAATGNGSLTATSIELVDGLSPVVDTSDEGVTLVLYRGDEELGRVGLALRPGEINTIVF